MGNVVGSNIFNIAVILGLSAVICPIRVALPVLKLDAPIMLACMITLSVLALGGEVGRLMGAGLVLMLLGYTAFNVYEARRQNVADIQTEFSEGVPKPSGSLVRDLVMIAGGLALLVVGSNLLVSSAVAIARAFSLSEAVIGLTIVAAGTSMPELATSVVAAFRKQPDIAVGNVVGSNIFNVLGVVGGASLASPLVAPSITRLDLGAMVGFSAAAILLMWSDRRLLRWEGAVLLAGFAAYLWALWPASAPV
jgi:cation:H+ antiporter